MKVIFIETIPQGWDDIEKGVLYEAQNIPIPTKGNKIFIDDKCYIVDKISYHFDTNGVIENYAKVTVKYC
jgi:hypothetical protein